MKITFTIYLLLIGTLLTSIVSAQTVTFGFDVAVGSYTNTDFGDWYSANSMTYGSGKEHSGTKALVFDDDAGAYLLYDAADGNGKDGGLGTVSFWYRHWDGDANVIKIKVQYNQAGGGWIDIGSEVTVTSTTYNQFTATVNLAGDDILFRVLSTAYGERLLIDDIALDSYSGGAPIVATLAISDDGSLLENAENGEQITMVVSSDTYVPSLSLANYSILNQPAGVSIGSISRVDDNTAVLTLSGNRTTDYDVDITNLTISINHQELVLLNSGDLTASSGVTFTAQVESVSISDDGSITEGAEDTEEITLTLSNAVFAASLTAANFSLTNQPAGVTIGSVTRLNDQTATLTLSGNRTTDYDVDITNLTVTIATSELVGQSTALSDNSGVAFTALVESVSISDDGSITEGAEDTEEITLTLSNAVFAASLTAANFSLTNQPAGVTIGSVTRLNDQTATLTLSGNRTTDYDVDITNLTVTIATSELVGQSTALSDNSGVTFTAQVESVSISSDGTISEDAENGEEITLTLNGTIFVPVLNVANFSILNQPVGVSIGSVSRVNNQTAILSLSGNRTTDYDADITNFTVSISASELVGQSTALSDNSGVTFTALNDLESISVLTDGNISEGSENAEVISVTLSGGTFSSSLTLSNWTISNAPAGVSIGSLNRVSNTEVEITLSGNASLDYDADKNASVSINQAELDDYAGVNLVQNGVIFTAINDVESFSMSSDGFIQEGSENGEQITVVLSGGMFKSSLTLSNWSISGAPNGVSIGSVSRIDEHHVTITLNGNALIDYDSDITNTTISIDEIEVDDYTGVDLEQNTGVTFTAINDAESISLAFDGNISEEHESGEIITVSLSGGTFVSTLTLGNWTLTGAPTGVSIGSVSRFNSTTVKITLSGNATVDYDIDITNAMLSIAEAEIDDYTGVDLTQNSGVVFTAVVESPPSVQASQIVFSNITASSMRLSWTRGNGGYCIVVGHRGSPVDAVPADLTSYLADNTFGDGDEIGTGNFVLYKGTAATVNVDGIAQGETYYFQVFEFNYSGVKSLYLTTTALNNPSSQSTTPNDVTNFTVDCISRTSAQLSWVQPSGTYDSVVIAMRQSTNPVHVISGDGGLLNASATFGLGTSFGSTTPLSYVVYKGRGNSVAVDGLNPGSSYTFKAIVYTGAAWSTGVNKSAQVAEIDVVSNLTYYAPSYSIIMNWDNPDFNCPDEVMVVAKSGSAVTTTPSGDGSSYTASAVFGSGTDIGTDEFVVYKGTLSALEITGLTNGVNYHFSLFVRDESSWSDPVQGNATPQDITVLFSGDLAIVAVNTNISGGDDEISLVCFDTLKTGTAIDFTDNGWERSNLNFWGSTEGTIRYIRTGPPVLPGQVFTFRGSGHLATDFTAQGLTDNGWTVSSLNGNYDFNLNSSDQIWILQYGNWTASGNTQSSTYNGNVLYGWTATGWAGDPGHGAFTSTAYSALYPGASCFNTNVVNTSNKDRVKYTGPNTATTRREWLSRINNSENWSGYSSTANFNSGGPNYVGGITFGITNSVYADGEWIGDKDTNWFNCGNWAELRVPDDETNVLIDDGALRACMISSTAEHSGDFEDTARCFSLTINDSTLYHADASASLVVEDDILISGGHFNLNSGSLFLKGNWNSSSASTFDTGDGKIKLYGNTNQIVENTAGDEVFFDLEIDNPFHVHLMSPVMASWLHFTKGKVFIENGDLSIVDSITNYSSISYVVTEDDKNATGHLIMNVGSSSQTFPIGNPSSYTPFTISLAASNADFKARVFSNVFSNGTGGTLLTGEKVEKTWVISPIGAAAHSANIQLTWNLNDESTAFGAEHASAAMMQNSNSGSAIDWSDWNVLNTSGSVNGLNPYFIQATGITSFGSFGVGSRCIIDKPNTSNIFHF